MGAVGDWAAACLSPGAGGKRGHADPDGLSHDLLHKYRGHSCLVDRNQTAVTKPALPLSVFIITRNEAKRIEATMESVRDWVAEIVVVDSGSQDNTVQLAENLGARVFFNEWPGFGGQKRFAEDQCSRPWLLNLDADEVVPADLRDEITQAIEGSTNTPAAYRMKIHNVYPGASKPRPFANDYNVVRLYHRKAGRYRDHQVYDRVVLQEGIQPKQLNAPLFHFPLLDLDQLIDKIKRQAHNGVDKLATKPAAILKLRLYFGFPLNFLRNYIARGHILGGWKGFVFALNTAYTRTLRIAMALERKEKQQES